MTDVTSEATVSPRPPSTWSSLVAVWRSRALLGSLVSRDIRGRYRASALGIGWALMRPLALLAIYGLVLGGFLGGNALVPDFAVFIFVGLMTFGIFSQSVSGGAGAITGNVSLVKKVAFPREILPILAVVVALVNTALQIPVLLLGYLLTGAWPAPSNLVLAIPATLIIVTLSLAAALLLGALNVYSRDIEYFIEVVLLFLFWLSPVLYPWTIAANFFESRGWDLLGELYLANPLTSAVIAYQNALWPGALSEAGQPFVLYDSVWSPRLWLGVAISVVALWIAQRVFVRLQGNFVREL